MALINRLARLMRADLHALLDRLEAPDLVLAQALRDMERLLEQERTALARGERILAGLARQQQRLSAILAETDAALEDCLTAGQDDLARAVIRRRLDTEQEAARLAQRQAQLSADQTALAQRVSGRSARLDELRAAAEAARGLDDLEGQDGPADLPTSSELGVRAADIEIALLQAKRQREARP